MNWKIVSGNVHQINSLVFVGIPFTATDQFYFLTIQNDTVSSPIKTGNISNIFPINLAPLSLYFDYFYVPTFFTQRFKVQILFTKWRNNNRDTILFSSNLFAPKLDTLNNLLIKWNKQKIDLQNSYRDTAMPDSASISIQSDEVTPQYFAMLFLDNLKFSLFKVGVNEVSIYKEFKIYPNPAKDLLNIDVTDILNFKFQISDFYGREILNGNSDNRKQFQFDISELKNGIYFLNLKNDNGLNISRKIVLLR